MEFLYCGSVAGLLGDVPRALDALALAQYAGADGLRVLAEASLMHAGASGRGLRARGLARVVMRGCTRRGRVRVCVQEGAGDKSPNSCNPRSAHTMRRLAAADAGNVCTLLVAAHKHGCADLERYCMELLLKHSSEVSLDALAAEPGLLLEITRELIRRSTSGK